MKIVISLLITCMIMGLSQTQAQPKTNHPLKTDSSIIRFLPMKAEVDSSDLVFDIEVRNISKRPIGIYKTFVDSYLGDPIGNIRIDVEKKDSTGKYSPNEMHSNCSPGFLFLPLAERYKADNDLKKLLAANRTDTTRVNLLELESDFWPGEYRIKIFLKVKTIYDKKTKIDSLGLTPFDDPEYIHSQYIYFKVPKYVFKPRYNPDGTRRN